MKESVNPKFFLHHIKFQGACIKTIMCLTQSLHPSSRYLDIILFHTLFIENNTSILSPEAQTISVVVFWMSGTTIENSNIRTIFKAIREGDDIVNKM